MHRPAPGRALLELHLDIANKGRFIAQPAKIVVKNVPVTQRQPDPQPRNRHPDLVHSFRISPCTDSRSVLTQPLEPGLGGDGVVTVAHGESAAR